MKRTTLTDGSEVTEGHLEIDPKTGMQKGYVVLSEEGDEVFVRPVRDSYTHKTCGGVTVMHHTIAKTFARDPKFYSEGYCATCKSHFPNSELFWGDGTVVGS